MIQLSVQEIVAQASCFVGKNTLVYPSQKGVCLVTKVVAPEGPIYIKRRGIKDSTPWKDVKEIPISSTMIWRYVNALKSGVPTNIDRVLGASYNTRSALEAIVAHLPNFFICYPSRITEIGSQKITFEKGHKYIIWRPEQSHPFGQTETDASVNGFINESAVSDIYFDAQNVERDVPKKDGILDPSIRRMHSQMQVLLSQTANWMNLRSWIAIEDHGIVTGGKSILSYPYIVKDLSIENGIKGNPDAIDVAKHIDCIWFNGGMPFVFEVEHSTGVTSGLCRMNKLRERANMDTDYVIVAPDADRQMVLQKANSSQFEEMRLWYLPYSNLIEMSDFASKHTFRGSSRTRGSFAKMFMEEISV